MDHANNVEFFYTDKRQNNRQLGKLTFSVGYGARKRSVLGETTQTSGINKRALHAQVTRQHNKFSKRLTHTRIFSSGK